MIPAMPGCCLPGAPGSGLEGRRAAGAAGGAEKTVGPF